MDDRMQVENQSSLATNLMGQHPEAGGSGVAAVEEAAGTEHPDSTAILEMFGGTPHAAPAVSQSSAMGLDLSALHAAEGAPAPGTIREDLVQQAAKALVKDGTDAFLAITHRMTPDEVGATLKTARTWRRSDPKWQKSFQSGPETGFKFIDRKTPNKAESLATEVVSFMHDNQLDPALTPSVVRQLLRERQIPMSEFDLVRFAAKIATMV